MRYYIIPAPLAEQLSLTEYRRGNTEKGYVVTAGDLAAFGVEKAVGGGAQETTEKEARKFIKALK